VSITVATWNIRGKAQPDLERVGQVLESFGPDVVALHEVRRRQGVALAQRLGWMTAHWTFKHWPIPSLAEGHAVLSPHRLVGEETVTLTCGVQSCANDQFLQIDHIVPLEDHGRTELDNLWRICTHHTRSRPTPDGASPAATATATSSRPELRSVRRS
jgi:hypothetical protein